MIPRRVVNVSLGQDLIVAEVAGEPGGRTPLLLLHGAGGNRLTWWQQVADLARDRLVVVPDGRAAGRSTDVISQMGPVQQALDLEALREHLQIERWDAVGHSYGGWPVLRLKATGTSVRRCVVMSSFGGVFPPAADAHWQQLAARLAAEGWAGESGVGVSESISPWFTEAHPEIAHLYQLINGMNPRVDLTVPGLHVRDFDLPLAPVPDVTYVVGEHDTIAPAALARESAAVVGASFVEVSGTGHLPFFEKPAEVNALLRSIFDA